MFTYRKMPQSPRRNCDKNKPCKIGEKIIQLCKSYDMQIGNGRTKGDFMGNYTHHNKNTGQSTIDLALISDNLYPFIDDFKVLPQTVYSDHCKIVLTVKNLKPIEQKKVNYKWLQYKADYKWDENSPEKYKTALGSPKVIQLIEKCKHQIETSQIQEAGIALQNIFIQVANVSLERKEAKEKRNNKKTKTKKKWFDKECSQFKKLANKAASLKHKHPWNNQLRENHRKMLKDFKKLCRTKKYEFWKNEIKDLDNLRNESNFWKKWKFFGEDIKVSNQFPENLDGQIWENHFKLLFKKIDGDIDTLMKKENLPIDQTLNSKFKLDELKLTIKGLKNNKATGTDRIANEFLKLAPDNLLKIYLDYINLNLEKSTTCTEWCQGIISLIHKDGTKEDPNNFRGICIMNTLLKIICTLLNNRLTNFCAKNKLINEEQIGFQKNNRTSDHIATLKTIVNKYVVDKKGKKLFTCFIDFQKAFDSVWHDGLFRKLENKGINGNFLNLIKNIYKSTKCAVKINQSTTNYFKYEKGVQQGNPLSPLLFNLFINDIFETLKNDPSTMITLNEEKYFNTLMYADDLILMSTSKKGLQKSLNSLYNTVKNGN